MQEGLPADNHENTLLGLEERLKGRPPICSDCGLCASSFRPLMSQSCTFVKSHVAETETRLHGRTRNDGDELLFGVYRDMYAARLTPPHPHAQWSGIVTHLGARLLERGMVEGVITTGAISGTRYAPRPFIARTPEEVLESAGNKPCISPGLRALDEAKALDMKRLAVIGTGCQIQALRAAEKSLDFEQLYLIGIPCSDNVSYPDLLHFLKMISHSPDTVVHHEFVQDFRVWLRHEDGHVEKVNFIDIPMDKIGNIFPDACMSCFDYPNALADITIGYMGARVGFQWMMTRTEIGEELFNLISPDLEFDELFSRGNRTEGVKRYIQMLANPPGRPPSLVRKFIAFLQRWRGAKGVEFARSITEMKLLRNLQHVREHFPDREEDVVPYHVYRALAAYEESYQTVYNRPLRFEEPQAVQQPAEAA